jgi:hypothetical protein
VHHHRLALLGEVDAIASLNHSLDNAHGIGGE